MRLKNFNLSLIIILEYFYTGHVSNVNSSKIASKRSTLSKLTQTYLKVITNGAIQFYKTF